MVSCSNCGEAVDPGARFCARCGAPQSLAGAQPEDVPSGALGAGSRWELCEIGWWRGYLKSDFFAIAHAPGRAPYEVARSRTFWWHRGEPPPNGREDVRKAHDELVERLRAAGWESLGQTSPWYASTFRRRSSLLRPIPPQASPGVDEEAGA